MAITQQIARISENQLAACRQSSEELNRLRSFELRPRTDYADLDWAGSALIRLCKLAGLDARIVAALRRALEGDAEVNAAYRDHPDTVWEHPVTALEPTTVEQVSGVLRELEPLAVLTTLPSNPHEATAVLGKNWENFEGNLREYLAQHLTTLQSFYEETAQRGLAVVLWWD